MYWYFLLKKNKLYVFLLLLFIFYVCLWVANIFPEKFKERIKLMFIFSIEVLKVQSCPQHDSI